MSPALVLSLETLFAVSVGAVLVGFGYKLFCCAPVRRNRSAFILLNLLPGALMALFGMAILTIEARSVVTMIARISSHRPAIPQRGTQPAAHERSSFHPA